MAYFETEQRSLDSSLALDFPRADSGLVISKDSIDSIERRYGANLINLRGIPKLGEKPKDRDPSPPGPAGSGTKPPTGRPGTSDGAGKAPGTGTKPKFDDEELEDARMKGEDLILDLDKAIFNQTPAPE